MDGYCIVEMGQSPCGRKGGIGGDKRRGELEKRVFCTNATKLFHSLFPGQVRTWSCRGEIRRKGRLLGNLGSVGLLRTTIIKAGSSLAWPGGQVSNL